MSGQTLSFKTQYSLGYIKRLKYIIGDALTNCNTKPMRFRWCLVETDQDRSLGVQISTHFDNPKAIVAKLERYGIQVLSVKNNPVFGYRGKLVIDEDEDHIREGIPGTYTTLIVRIIEEEDDS